MKLQFDANQEYQLKAIEAAVNLFKGQADNSGGLRFEMTESADGYLCARPEPTTFLLLGLGAVMVSKETVRCTSRASAFMACLASSGKVQF